MLKKSTASIGLFITPRRYYLRLSRTLPNPTSERIQLKNSKGDKSSKCTSHELMVSAGVIQASSTAGTFNLLPPATRALQKLHALIDYEMVNIGAQKLSLPCLSAAKPWRKTGRFDDMGDELLKLQDRRGVQHCLAPTHEEAITELVAAYSHSLSARIFPLMLYQIGRKYRDEPKPKNGLLRCREFEMKDLYTFDMNVEQAQKTYDSVCSAYSNLLRRLGVNYVKVAGDVGAMGGLHSHEYHLLAPAGEDDILICTGCQQAINAELIQHKDPQSKSDHQEPKICSVCGGKQEVHAGIEIAHAFLLGTRYSQIFGACAPSSGDTGKSTGKQPLQMGCFGIGVTRLLAASIEVLSFEDHLRWPSPIAPYQVVVIPQKQGYQFDKTLEIAEQLASHLSSVHSLHGDVVMDDRHKLSIARRLHAANAVGYPWAVIVGNSALEDPARYELVDVYNNETHMVSLDEVVSRLTDVGNSHGV